MAWQVFKGVSGVNIDDDAYVSTQGIGSAGWWKAAWRPRVRGRVSLAVWMLAALLGNTASAQVSGRLNPEPVDLSSGVAAMREDSLAF